MLKHDSYFLNHGSFGAMPRVVFDAQTEWRKRIEAEPIEMIGRRMNDLIDAAKIPVGKQFAMNPADFGFVANATEGVNAVLRSLTFSPGDELLTTNHVYHAIRQTMKLVARQTGPGLVNQTGPTRPGSVGIIHFFSDLPNFRYFRPAHFPCAILYRNSYPSRATTATRFLELDHDADGFDAGTVRNNRPRAHSRGGGDGDVRPGGR
jgi:hypothetical protein